MRIPVPWFLATFAVLMGTADPGGHANASPPDFDRSVAPVLSARCLDCHRGPKPKGGLDLANRVGVQKGGKSGQLVSSSRPEESLFWQRIESDEMPPKHPLPESEKKILREWIASGATWGTDPIDPFRFTTGSRAGLDWWSLRPLARVEVPTVHDVSWARNPIDRFVLARLESSGLRPSAGADRRTLIRRLSFELLGLPPGPGRVEAFVRDEDPLAFEALAEEFLASPHLGERWARHWLDVVRYGESDGFERNAPRPDSWPYRDWVIRAINDDLPYDRFCKLQVAGDVLHPDDPSAIAAAGYLVAGLHNTVVAMNEVAQKMARQDELEDMVGSVGQTFLGLTVNCGRCHDHKFDPISQEDYYRLAGALSGVQHGERIVSLTAAREAIGKRRPFKIYTATSKQPPVTRVLVRGQVTEPAAIVEPGVIRCLAAACGSSGTALPPDSPEADRRRALASWLTHPANPLLARVIVNRLWQHHFGTGLVETPNDFGFNGGRPSHPELLDWLAGELIVRGYRLKEIHRLIVTSTTYRQASAPGARGQAVDAEDRLLWRMKPWRVEGEVVRDSMLAVAGLLNTQMGGPSFSDYRETNGQGTAYFHPFDPVGPPYHRRSVYRFVPRGGNQGLLDTFDCPDPSAAAPRRSTTTTPVQALALWNDAFSLRMAEALARRVRDEIPGPDAASMNRRLGRVYELALQRAPRTGELDSARRLVSAHGLEPLCRAILNTNEFVTVE
jgi:hypothetical protein